MNIIIAIIIFSILILIHEFGHYMIARLGGIHIEEFALGMGPKLFSFSKKGTVYSVRVLPFGGFCKMLGEDESSEDSQSFSNKPILVRIAVVAAGSIFNILLALIGGIILVSMIGYTPSEVNYVIPDSAAEAAGFQEGDTIVKLNGKRIYIFEEVSLAMYGIEDQPTTFVLRDKDGKEREVTLVPKFDEEQGRYMIGFSPYNDEDGIFRQNPKGLDAVKYGYYNVRLFIKSALLGIKQLIAGQVGREDVAGAVGIVNLISDTYNETVNEGARIVFVNMLNITIYLSVSLGVMNLLPIPALDGGRLVFLFYELITRKKVPQDKEALVHGIGMLILLGLMVFLVFNDIVNIFNR